MTVSRERFARMRLLLLAPWPFRRPRNGGQLRASATVQAYASAGFDVRHAGFYHAAETPAADVWASDIALDADVMAELDRMPAQERRSEMAWWKAVAGAPNTYAAFVAAVTNAGPQVLQFEEIALWPVVKRLCADGHLDGVMIVHSSYNFETVAWRHRAVAGASITPETVRDIAAFEREIARECDLIVTVSEGDAAQFRRLGAGQVCVAPNGVASLPTQPPDAVSTYLPLGSPYAIFVSSAHPPNAHGIVDLAAQAQGHPLSGGEIVVCGKVGSLMRAAPRFQKARRVLDRCRFLGWVDDHALATLYAGARVVILPKLYSGGSNLKTAEAIVSGRPIVATRLAFEGFEACTDLNDITITDDPSEFWESVDRYLSSGHTTAHRSPESVQDLLWENSLRPMVAAVSSAFG